MLSAPSALNRLCWHCEENTAEKPIFEIRDYAQVNIKRYYFEKDVQERIGALQWSGYHRRNGIDKHIACSQDIRH